MAKRSTLAEQLATLNALADREIDEAGSAALRHALCGTNNVLAAKAAQIVGRHRVLDLCDLLPEVFRRFSADAAKSDRQCSAKTQAVIALRACDIPAGEIFLRGARLVQMEPAYGGPVDTAATLRAECALGLAAMLHPEASLVLTDLLVDPEPSPRAAAARGLSYVGGQTAALLLRLKIRTGDPDPGVLGECFEALLAVDPRAAVAFVAGYLDSPDDDIRQSAALAIGEHGGEAGLRALLDCWNRMVLSRDRRLLALPIALSRRPDSRSFLLAAIRDADPGLAVAALDALRIHQADAAFVEQIRAVALGRGDPLVSRAYASAFG